MLQADVDYLAQLRKNILDGWNKAIENYKNVNTNSENITSENIKYSIIIDNEGNSYWQIESNKDIFKDITDTYELKKAAYNFILRGDKGGKINEIIDGKPLTFIRISAKEYVYGRQSKKLPHSHTIKK
jgi:hypothetical protein